MRRAGYALVGGTCGLAGLVSLPYLFMAMHDLFDAWRGELHGNPWWSVYVLVGIMGSLSLGAFFMAYRFLRYAASSPPR